MKKIYLVFLVVVAIFCCLSIKVNAQNEIDSSEIKWVFPELENFHEIIYPIWHEYYPAEDVTNLIKMVPEIKKKVEEINKASLPGILREKEGKWKEGINELNVAAQDYYLAADNNDKKALLDAAEKLHSKYENLVRIVKPLSKQIDSFHQSLYIVYHKYLPTKNYASISNMIDEIITKAQDVYNNVPKKMESKKEEYLNVAEELINAAKDLKDKLSSNDSKVIDAAVELMHTKYVKLENLF